MKLSPTRMRAAFSAVAIAVAVALVPAVGHAGTGAEAAPKAAATDRGWNDWSCTPSEAHPRPVVLVHGTLGNATTNWIGLAPYLKNRGYCVFSLDYGKLDGVPIFHGLDDIEKSAGELGSYVDRVLDETGANEVDIVGHSQGGMMPRYYLKFLGGASKVNALVGLAPSSHGTDVNGLTKLFDYWPGAREAIGDHTPALEQQIAGSDFMNKLNEGGDTVPGVQYTVIATRYDLVVTPHTTQFLDGPDVKNVLLQDLCPISISGHVAIALVDRAAWHETANALDPANATPAGCLS